ncbi:MAG: STAS domain-containing protein [Bacilli bacterium]|nr:STAS domain-containing protein [Bacilli bacterium]
MEATLTNNVLTLKLVGEINSLNSEDVAKEIEEDLKDKQFDSLVFDFEGVTYISSAGLRIVLRYKQRYKNLSIINVSLEVYDVFSMTGFTSMMNISKALTKIKVYPSQIIGDGYFSTVYRIDKDTIIKVFKRADNISSVEKEMALAKEAFILGIPTAITFDIVDVDGKFGVRFEMLDSISLRDAFRDQKDNFDKLCKQYAELLKTINTTEVTDEKIPSTKYQWLQKIEAASSYFTEEENDLLLDLFNKIPDGKTFVHGDCHVKNILIQNDELFLIDMETLSRGDKIFELAGIYATYIIFEETNKGNNLAFLGLDEDLCKNMFMKTLEYYLGYVDEETLNKIRLVSYCHMIWWTLTYEKENEKRINHCVKEVKQLLKKCGDLIIR